MIKKNGDNYSVVFPQMLYVCEINDWQSGREREEEKDNQNIFEVHWTPWGQFGWGVEPCSLIVCVCVCVDKDVKKKRIFSIFAWHWFRCLFFQNHVMIPMNCVMRWSMVDVTVVKKKSTTPFFFWLVFSTNAVTSHPFFH